MKILQKVYLGFIVSAFIAIAVINNMKKQTPFLEKLVQKYIAKKEVKQNNKPVSTTNWVMFNPAAVKAIVIPKGGSLCGTLGITPEIALMIAQKENLKYWYKHKKLYVLVQPGMRFAMVTTNN